MRIQFDHQLEQLKIELIHMGSLCEQAILTACKYLLNETEDGMDQVLSTEKEIDQKERDIERLCIKLLLEQQPVARDLRQISSALKMISDMERIGDQAMDIAEIAQYVKVRENASKIDIRKMAEATTKMVTESIESYVKRDLDMAYEVIKYDDVVDDLFVTVKDELIMLLAEDGTNSEFYIDLLMIAKYFERIGDHAENIAEWAIFSIKGTHES